MFGFLGRLTRARHRFCQANLSAYLDGELTARDRERVRQHLEQCEACQWDLRTLQQTVDLLHSLPQVRAPRSFQIPRSAPAPAVPFWMRPWAYGALRMATGAVAALLVITLAAHALSAPVMMSAPARDAALRALEVQEAVAPAEPSSSYGMGEHPPVAAEAAPAERAPHPLAPSTRGAQLAGTPAPTPCVGCEGGVAGDVQVLTPEEAARATAAPAGMGGGMAPTVTAPAPTPESPLAAVAPTEPALAKAYPLAPQPSAEPENGKAQPLLSDEATDGTAVQPAPGSAQLSQLRQSLVGYPWHWWAAGSGLLLAALAATTLWLRAKRARWPW